MVLGLMAIGASSAQAEEGNDWQVNGTVVAGSAKHPVEAEKIENETATLTTIINKTKVEFLCKSVKLNGVDLIEKGKLSEGTVTFHSCVTYLNESLSPPCEPVAGGTEKGLIVSEKGKGLLTLHEGQLLTKITPVGINFGKIELGEECSIGEEVPVAGTLTLKDTEVGVEKASHLIEPGPLTNLTALGGPATIKGMAIVNLVSGLKFKGFML